MDLEEIDPQTDPNIPFGVVVRGWSNKNQHHRARTLLELSDEKITKTLSEMFLSYHSVFVPCSLCSVPVFRSVRSLFLPCGMFHLILSIVHCVWCLVSGLSLFSVPLEYLQIFLGTCILPDTDRYRYPTRYRSNML
jgi:hypothetical protein